jgi:hypothetical protein
MTCITRVQGYGENIIRFLGNYIAKHIRQNSSLQEGQSLYLTGLFSNPETVKMLNQNGMLDCSCLASTQEEADTRIILHALYSDKLYLIFTRTNKLFPVRNNPTFNHLIHFCSENRLGSTVLFCLFDRALNVISITDIDDYGCQLKICADD